MSVSQTLIRNWSHEMEEDEIIYSFEGTYSSPHAPPTVVVRVYRKKLSPSYNGLVSEVKRPYNVVWSDGITAHGELSTELIGQTQLSIWGSVFINGALTPQYEGELVHFPIPYRPSPEPQPQPDPFPPQHPTKPSRKKETQILLSNQQFTNLFHFSGLRKPSRIPYREEDRFIRIENDSEFQQALLKVGSDREALIQLAQEFISGEEYQAIVDFLAEHIFALIELRKRLIKEQKTYDDPWVFALKNHGTNPLEIAELTQDSFLAIMILQVAEEAPENAIDRLTDLTLALRLLFYFIRREAGEQEESIRNALWAILFLPVPIMETILKHPMLEGSATGQVQLLGIGDLMYVRKKWLGYQLGEIARIENVMGYESRVRTQRELTRNSLDQTDQLMETWIEETLREGLTGFDIKKGIPISREHKVDIPNVTKTYTPGNPSTEMLTGNWTLQFNPGENSKEQAVRFVKALSDRLIHRANKTISRIRSQSVLDEKEQVDRTVLHNKKNPQPHTGIYRMVEKVSQSQLINEGHRLMLEITIPFPGEDLSDPPVRGQLPPGLKAILVEVNGFENLNRENYLSFAHFLGIGELLLPPDPERTLSLNLPGQPPELATPVPVPSGYVVAQATLNMTYNGTTVHGFLGEQEFGGECSSNLALPTGEGPETSEIPSVPPPFPAPLTTCQFSKCWDTEQGDLSHYTTLPVSLLTDSSSFSASIVVECVLTQEHFEEWQAAAAHQLATAFQQLQQAEDFQMQQAELHATQRELQRTTLQHRSKELLSQWIHTTESRFNQYFNQHPLQEAFYWDQLFWAFNSLPATGMERWFNSNQSVPHMNEFLTATEAKLILTVKEGFEQIALYTLWTKGLAWEGLPADAPILENQLFFASDLLHEHHPHLWEVIETWESIEPTSFLWLQDDKQLPWNFPPIPFSLPSPHNHDHDV